MMQRMMFSLVWKYLAARWRWVLFPFGLWVATRLSLLLLGYISLMLTPGLRGSSSPSLQPFPALDALCCWDCGWFDRLARLGYQNVNETNFWPGLPMAARLLMKLTGMRVGFAILTISNLACLGAYLTIYRLFVRLDGAMAARAGLVLFAAYPFAFFHASGYPETIMIFTSALALSLAMSRRHALAGIVLGLGILSRHLTVLLGGGLLAAQLNQRGWRRFFRDPAVLALALPFAVAGIYMVYCQIAWGDALSFWRARSTWGQTAWWSIFEAIRQAKRRPHIISFIPFALLPAIGSVALLRSRKYVELAAATLPLMAVLWLIGAFGLGRYSASCWAAFLPLGKWYVRHPRWQVPLLLFFALAQGWFFFLHSHHYEIQ
jgi:Dolichyl-phosphate-mannose-protein mannosyltransferase